jgi:hypothetical protein
MVVLRFIKISSFYIPFIFKPKGHSPSLFDPEALGWIAGYPSDKLDSIILVSS